MHYRFLFHNDAHAEDFFENSKNLVIEADEGILFIESDTLPTVYTAFDDLEALPALLKTISQHIPEGSKVIINAGEDKSSPGLLERVIPYFRAAGCVIRNHNIGYRTANLAGDGKKRNLSHVNEMSPDCFQSVHDLALRRLDGDKFGMTYDQFESFMDKKTSHGLLIGDGSAPKGFILGDVFDSGRQIFIRGLAVEKDAQGKGHGHDLMTAMFELARNKGVKQSMLWVEKTNSRAIRLYKTFGYRPYGDQEVLFEFTI